MTDLIEVKLSATYLAAMPHKRVNITFEHGGTVSSDEPQTLTLTMPREKAEPLLADGWEIVTVHAPHEA